MFLSQQFGTSLDLNTYVHNKIYDDYRKKKKRERHLPTTKITSLFLSEILEAETVSYFQ